MLLSSGIGIICTASFHLFLKKKWTDCTPKHLRERNLIYNMKASEFFRNPLLYQVAIIYTSSRLLLTLSLEYMPLFVNETVLSQSATLATVPLVSFLASCLASMAVERLSSCCGNRVIILAYY